MHKNALSIFALISLTFLSNACGSKKHDNDETPSPGPSLSDLDKKNEELKVKLEDLKSKREDMQKQLDQSHGSNEALKAKLLDADKSIAVLEESLRKAKADQAGLTAFAEKTLGPLQGLWQGDLEKGLSSSPVCKIFYQISGVNYAKAVVCQTAAAGSFESNFESGTFVDLIKLSAAAEDAANLDIHRKVFTKANFGSCATPGYHNLTTNIAWSKGFETAITVDVNADFTVGTTLQRGDAGRNAETCEHILSRPDRVGLEDAVQACRVFSTPIEELPSKNDLGCFQLDGNSGLSWTASPAAAL